jgi:hypothetical protein
MPVEIAAIRRLKLIRFFGERGALCPERAIPASEVPDAGKRFVRRLIRKGILRETNGRWYLDPERETADWNRTFRFLIAFICACGILSAILLRSK